MHQLNEIENEKLIKNIKQSKFVNDIKMKNSENKPEIKVFQIQDYLENEPADLEPEKNKKRRESKMISHQTLFLKLILTKNKNDSFSFVPSRLTMNTIFVSSIPSKLNPSKFSWKTEDGLAPFEITTFDLEDLEMILNASGYGAGVSKDLQQMFLKNQYN